jgi:signal transduction histidine kinase
VWIDQTVTQSPLGMGTVELDLGDLGIVVLDEDGSVASTNDRARQLLRAEDQSALEGRLEDLRRGLAQAQCVNGSTDETAVDVPGLGPIGVRSCAVAGVDHAGRVLLLRDARALPGIAHLLQQAASHRAFAFLARDWAHDLKGMLHVIRINNALLGRLLQRASPTIDPAMTRCLDAIPREVERLDRSLELMFAKPAEQAQTFDVGEMCARLKDLIAARAIRQRVEVVLELNDGAKEILGFAGPVQCALMNVILNALEAMPEEGRLVITVAGDPAGVIVRISDTGVGMQPQRPSRQWRTQFVNSGRQTGIGLHVTHAIVESHGGRIECASNVPRGTSIEITFPPASTGRLGHGSRTHR